MHQKRHTFENNHAFTAKVNRSEKTDRPAAIKYFHNLLQ